jgi:L-iditol 2-dehydrogenase
MKAVVKTKPGEGFLEFAANWPEPSPLPDEVKLRVNAAGICGTDIHIIKGTWRCDAPVVLGHEFCGTVVDAGDQVRGFAPGDRVVAANPARTCGNCYYCRAGNAFMCAERESKGYMTDGAFADYITIRAAQCHHLPDNVSWRQAALGEPVSVAVHAAIERHQVHAGDVVLISGVGCVGLLTLQVAKLEGARVVITGIDKDSNRMECARQLGADHVINAQREDVVAAVQDITGGRGADTVFECAGVAASLGTCLRAVKKQGTLVPLGMYPGPIEINFTSISMKELNVVGTYGYVWTSWQRAIQLMSEGKINADLLVSHQFALKDYEQAFQLTQDGTATKVVLRPDRD